MAEPCPVNGSENPIVMRQYSNAAARMARAYVTSMRCVACPTREAHVLHSKRRLRRGTCRVYAARSSAGGTRACGYALGSVLSLNTGLVAAQFQVIFHPSTRLRRAAVSQRGEEGTDKIERSDWADWSHSGDFLFAMDGCIYRAPAKKDFSSPPKTPPKLRISPSCGLSRYKPHLNLSDGPPDRWLRDIRLLAKPRQYFDER